MKTALEQFLDWYNDYIKQHGCQPSEYDVNFFINSDFKNIEKKQITDAYIECWMNDGGNGNHKIKEAEQYFELTYNPNQNG